MSAKKKFGGWLPAWAEKVASLMNPPATAMNANAAVGASKEFGVEDLLAVKAKLDGITGERPARSDGPYQLCRCACGGVTELKGAQVEDCGLDLVGNRTLLEIEKRRCVRCGQVSKEVVA
jgi:hypothetical protein